MPGPEITSVYGDRASITFHPARHYYTVTVPGVCRSLYQPSVTSILKMKDKSDVLVKWAVRSMTERIDELMPPGDVQISRDKVISIVDVAKESYHQVKSDAADVGSLVHRVLHQLLLSRSGLAERPTLPVVPDTVLAPNLTPALVEMANKSINAGVRFFDDHDIEVIQAETPRWSPTYGYVGTGDLIAKVDGDMAVLDYKTGKAIYDEYFLQTAAYQKAYEEEFSGEKIDKRVIVNVGRDGRLSSAERYADTLTDDFTAFRALLYIWRWNQKNGRFPKEPPRVIGPLDRAIAGAKAA